MKKILDDMNESAQILASMIYILREDGPMGEHSILRDCAVEALSLNKKAVEKLKSLDYGGHA